MKKLIVTVIFAMSFGKSFSQVPATTYPNGSNNTSPGNPGQPVQPYNGTNPAGQPNQNGNNTTIPDPTKPNNTYPNSTNPVNPSTAPATPGSTYPSTPGTPNTTSPAMPSSPATPNGPHNQINRLFQDPARTPREPQRHDPVKNHDGSTGKYKKNHRMYKGTKFATNNLHLKKSKQHSDNGKEGTASTTTR